MGSIPEFKRSPIRSSVIASNIGQAGQVAKAVAGLGGVLVSVAQAQQRVQDQSYVTSKSIELEDGGAGVFNQWQQDNQNDPLGKIPDLQSSLSDFKQTLLEDAPSDSARVTMDRVFGSFAKRLGRNASRWENKQLIQNAGAAAEDSINRIKISAFRNPSQAVLDASILKIDAVTAPLIEITDAKIHREANLRGKRQVVLSSFDGMVSNNDLKIATALINSRKYDEILGVEGVQKINDSIARRERTLKNLRKKTVQDKFKNPWKFLDEAGESIDDQPLDFTTNITNSFEKRLAFRNEMEAKHQMKVPLFREEEINQFMFNFEKGNIQVQTALLSNLSTNLPDDTFDDFAQEVFKKNAAIGVALSLADQDPQTSKDLIAGSKIIKSGTFPIPSKDIKATINAELEGAIQQQEVRAQLMDSILALYAQTAFSQNEDPEVDLEDRTKSVMNRILGPIVEINGAKTLSFRDDEGNFLDEDEFEDFFEDLTTEKIQKTHGDVPRDVNKNPIVPDDLEDLARLEPIGDGIYLIKMNFNGVEEFALDKNVQPFELNLNLVLEEFGKPIGLIEAIFKKGK